MTDVSTPAITTVSKAQDYTKITFKPDLNLFHMEKIDDDLLSVLYRRVYDLAGCMRQCKVILNGQRLHIKDFKSYTDMFVTALEKGHKESLIHAEDTSEGPKPMTVYERINDRWEIAFSVSDGSFNQVSFVNSIATTSGGTHVNYVADQIVTKISDLIKKSKIPIKPSQIRNNMFLFVNCLIENPAFTSQTKEQLTTRKTGFGSTCELSPEFLKKVLKTPILDRVKDIATRNADNEIRKTDGGKARRIKGMAKLEDANKAGTREGYKCTLVLTEGDSAMSLAVSGLAVVGRDYYGVFPLRGKLLNVREATHDQIMKNTEIQAIKQIMGLQHKKHYTSTKELRYGHIMIMTDQDHDGSHIKGLIINFLESTFPGLLEIPGFLIEFITPIIKVSILRGKKISEVIPFYTMPQYEEWRETIGKTCTWKKKYYKGLGSSGPVEGREYFSRLDKHLKTFHQLQNDDKSLIELAFSKKKADERKDWLRQFRPGTHMDPSLTVIPISDFINKELILFSIADNMRSIPSVLDGLKPGQRKVLYGCFKRNLKSEIKVAQLAGYISEQTGYHHGEQSLVQTIVSLAQDFVGSNNLYLLLPKGSFGSRAAGGKDSSAPRYIHTELNPLTRTIFHPADEKVYKYMEDDEATVEPEWYAPILPMLLVNGSEGIGTGWSTNIPPYNPTDIVSNLRRLMSGEEMLPMVPWFRGWTGTLEELPDNKFRAKGIITQIDETTLEISELPPHTWTINMRDFLLNQLKDRRDSKAGWIEDFTEDHGLGIKFDIKLSPEEMQKSLRDGLLNRFKLTSSISLNNMVAFDPQNRIKKYTSPLEIINDFYFVRLEFYQKRKNYLSNQLNNQLTKLTEQARFVKMIIDKKFSVTNRKKVAIIEDLQANKFPSFTRDGIPSFIGLEEFLESEEADDNEDLPEDVEDPRKNKPNYDYLLGMALWSLTKERYERLLRDRDEKEEELNILLKKTPKDLWNEDLDVFLEKWEIFLEEDREQREALIPKSKGKKGGKGKKVGKATKRKRNANDSDNDDDDDDDFVIGTSKKKTKVEDTGTKRAPSKRARKPTIKKESPELSSSPEPDVGNEKKGQTTLDSFKSTSKPIKKEKDVSLPPPFPRTKREDEYDKNPDDLFATLASSILPEPAVKSVVDDVKSTITKPTVPPPPKSKFTALFLSDDDDDDIFSPKKQAPKGKFTASKSSISKPFSFDSDDEDSTKSSRATVKKTVAKPTTKSIFDSDSDGAFSKPSSAPNTKKTSTKSSSILDLDSDKEISKPVKAAPTKKAAATKRSASKSIWDDNSDVEMAEVSKPVAKAKSTASKTAKPRGASKVAKSKATISDSDEGLDDIPQTRPSVASRPKRSTRGASKRYASIDSDSDVADDHDDDKYGESFVVD